MSRRRIPVQQTAIALTVVSQHILKNVVQLAKVVIMRGHLQHVEKAIPPLGAVRRGLPTKAHGLRNDIADVTAIALLRRAITGTMGEQFAHSKA